MILQKKLFIDDSHYKNFSENERKVSQIISRIFLMTDIANVVYFKDPSIAILHQEKITYVDFFQIIKDWIKKGIVFDSLSIDGNKYFLDSTVFKKYFR